MELVILAALAIAGLCLYLALRGGKHSPAAGPVAVNPMNPAIWRIGPVIKGKNYSVGLPEIPLPHPEGWCFDIPYPNVEAGHVHYVTFDHGPLTGKRRIVLRYRIETEGQLHARTAPGQPAMLTLYFQRKGDNWSAKGKYDSFRWYATFVTVSPLGAGSGEIVAQLDGPWTGAEKSTKANDPAGFDAAINNAQAVGFVLGGGDGYGHGVFATAPARFIVASFRIE